jgi:hypothetical protein
LIQHYIGWRIIPAAEGSENGCEMTYFGSNFGNDTPAWTTTFFEFYDWQIDFLPEVCFGGAAASEDTAPVTDGTETPVEPEETAPASL